MKSFIKRLLLMAVILIASSCENYSTGTRVGVITKFSEKGVWFKSHEIEMKVAPGISANQQMVGQYETFEMSIDNDNAIMCITPIEDIKKYAESGVAVIIEYQQTEFLNWFNNRGETCYFIKSIIPVEQKELETINSQQQK